MRNFLNAPLREAGNLKLLQKIKNLKKKSLKNGGNREHLMVSKKCKQMVPCRNIKANSFWETKSLPSAVRRCPVCNWTSLDNLELQCPGF